MKDGNMKNFEGEGSVGLIASQLTLQGPLRRDRTSFIVSARRTYIDLLVRPFLPSDEKGGYHFYDLNAKLNHIFSPDSRVFLSLYSGDDRFWNDVKSEDIIEKDAIAANFGWGNITSTLRWNYLFSSQLFGNLTAIYSRYQLSTAVDDRSTITIDGERETDTLRLRYRSGIRDWGLKLDFDYIPNPAHYIRFGGSGTLHTYSPGAAQIKVNPADGAPEDTTLAAQVTDALEYSLYGEDDVQLTKRLKANVGLHTSGFLVNDEFYTSWQPRISTRYLLPADWAVKASYALMRQYIHLLSNSTVGLPTDLWLPATERVRPQQSRQFGVGLARQFKDQYEFSVEGYYKTMTNLIEYREGASFLVGFGESEDWPGQGGDRAGVVVWCRAIRAEEAGPHHRLDRLYSFLDQAAFRPAKSGAHLPLSLRPPARPRVGSLTSTDAIHQLLPHLGVRNRQCHHSPGRPLLRLPTKS